MTMVELQELLLDVLWQACGQDEDGMIDTIGLSAYEQAANYLFKHGFLDKKNDRIYFLARPTDLKSTIGGGKI